MYNNELYAALRVAIFFRRVSTLRHLLYKHGFLAFAGAIANCSPRVATDALSLLTASERAAVLRHLPTQTRARLRPLGLGIDICDAPTRTRADTVPHHSSRHAGADPV